MTLQDIITQVENGEITTWQAADMLEEIGIDPVGVAGEIEAAADQARY